MKVLSLLAVLAFVAVANEAMADASTATPGSGGVQFEITGVGMGIFANAAIASKPGTGNGTDRRLCLTLEGGSRDNSLALIKWVKSNSAGVALASKPEAMLTVTQNQNGLRKGQYHFSHITVDDYTEKADQDLSHPRLDGLKVRCDSLEEPSSPGHAG